MPKFEVVSEYQPSGDQPQAIAALAEGIENSVFVQLLERMEALKRHGNH